MRSWLKYSGAAILAAAMPAAGSAQLFVNDPPFQKGPIEGSDPIVGLPIPGATPAEYRAHLLWNMRAGLNVAEGEITHPAVAEALGLPCLPAERALEAFRR